MLDEFIKDPNLTMVGCCNELNAGYAADGYARMTGGIGAVMVTYMVGGLSVINAVAGAYSDDLPVICISGGPNTLDSQENHIIHHTIGERELYQQSQCFKPIVAKTFVIRHPDEAASMIDEALTLAVKLRKPVYIEVPVNLATFKIDAPAPMAESLARQPPASDSVTLEAVVDAVLDSLRAAVKPVLLAGSKLRKTESTAEFLALANALECGVAVMPDAKGLYPESHPHYMGRYWGGVSSPYVSEVVESSDLLVLAGPVLNDYTTMGWTAHLSKDKRIVIGSDYVIVGRTRYSNVDIKDVLASLAERVTSKPATLAAFRRYAAGAPRVEDPCKDVLPSDKLSLRFLQHAVEKSLTADSALMTETGDSWFIGQRMGLPDGAKYLMQMQYGSIGWAVGATLGAGIAASLPNLPGGHRRLIALIGDGSFQVTAQELSTLIRYNVKATILLLNNQGYTIEVEIHDGAYNDIQDWNYAQLVSTFNNTTGNGLGLKAGTCGELTLALEKAEQHEGVCLIECALNRDDCTEQLLRWGSTVAKANGRLK